MTRVCGLVPRHSGFDWLGVTENGQVLGGAEHLDAARDAWLAADMAEALQREDHLVHGRRGELEMALHVGLGRGTAVDAGIGVDEGQVLPLPLGELFADIATRSIHLRLSRRRGKMNIRYRVELSEAERSELGSLLRGGQHSELRSCWRPTPGCRTRPLPRASVWAVPPSTGPSATSWRALSGKPCMKSPVPAPSESSPARRKLFWSRPRAPARPRAALAGPSNCSPARWCASPSTIASRANPCAGAWPRTSSSPGARRCGACRRSTASTSRAWRTCFICTPNPSTRRAQWCASTRALFI